MVHADFKNTVIGIFRHPRQCQRHTPMVVEGSCRGMHLAASRKHMPQRFLGRRFAGRSGHCNDLALAAHACGHAKLLKSTEHIRHDNHRDSQPSESGQFGFGHDDQRRPLRHGGAGVVVTVHFFALDGKKGLTFLNSPAVYRNSCDAFRHVTQRPAGHGRNHRFTGPQKAHATAFPSALSTSSWSEK